MKQALSVWTDLDDAFYNKNGFVSLPITASHFL
jgi:hypothetical protein